MRTPTMNRPLLLVAAWLVPSVIAGADPAKKPFPTPPSSGAFQDAHAGQVVFTSSPLPVAALRDDVLVTKVKWDDPLYLWIFTADSAANTVAGLYPAFAAQTPENQGQWASWQWEFRVDEKLVCDGVSTELSQGEAMARWNALPGAFFHVKGDAGPRFGDGVFRACDAYLLDGRTLGLHTVTVTLRPATVKPERFLGPVAAAGTFSLEITGDEIDPGSDRYCLPLADHADPALEKEMAAVFETAFNVDARVKAVHVLERDWTLERDKAGVVQGRLQIAAIGAQDAEHCFYQRLGFSQEKEGKAFARALHVTWGLGEHRVPCGCFE